MKYGLFESLFLFTSPRFLLMIIIVILLVILIVQLTKKK